VDDFILDNLIVWYSVNIAGQRLLLLSAKLQKSALKGIKKGIERFEKLKFE
jgi:hypothetical protein